MEELGIDEFEYKTLFKRIRIKRSSRSDEIAQSPNPLLTPEVRTPQPLTEEERDSVPVSEEKEAIKGAFSIKSPLVGTFYRAPAPGAEPFVKEGDLVEAGQVVAIVEAMKVMNEIEADRRGRVLKILVEDGEPVEYGQDLILLSPL